MQPTSPRRFTGFTLIELLVAVVIIGLLTTAATASFLNAQRRARDNARKTTVNNLANAVETFYAAKRMFPGLASTASSVDYKGCMQKDSSNNVVYAYSPLDKASACSTKAAIANVYTPADYNPYPAWVPGLGEYINPFPIDKQYVDGDLTSMLSQNTNTARTYTYQQLSGGYMIFARLEDTSDKDVIPAATVYSDTPRLVSGNITVASSGIYMVRK